ncbi:MAG: AAA family ATPase [Bacillota bacterium]
MENVLEHFQLQRLPFDRALLARDFFGGEGFSELCARLRYACTHRYCMLVTGEVGTGKSSALRALQAELDPGRYRFIYLADSRLPPRAFYEHTLAALGITPTGLLARRKRAFWQVVRELTEHQRMQLVVAIDEAHTLGHAMLQKLRFLLNSDLDARSLFTLLLVGQPELKATLRPLVYMPVAQRLDLTFHLGSLPLAETQAYILHQLRLAGCDHPIFTQQVGERIHAYTKGIPRLINRLARDCLLDAASRQDPLVEAAHLARVLADLET